MRLVYPLALLATAALFPACGGEHMYGNSSELASEITAAESELARHHTAVQQMSSTEQLPPEVSRHDGAMLSVFGHMNGMMSDMGHCASGAMRETMDGMHFEMDMHARTLQAADSLEAARLACTVHMEEMTGMLDRMRVSFEAGYCSMW